MKKGKDAILNENPDMIKITEKINSNCDESSNKNLPFKALFNGIISLNIVDPDNPYNWEIPIKITAELVALKIKYLKDISNEWLFLLRESMPIKGNEVSSRATQAVIISDEDVSIIIPLNEIINNAQNSDLNLMVLLKSSLPTVAIDNESINITILNSIEYLSIEITE